MKIAIIGGGITGLTTALALHKLGHNATVYERAKDINEIGAGIWLQPNAMKICDWLGIKGYIEERGNKIKKMEVTYSNLTPIKEIKQDSVKDEFKNQTLAIHRGKLQSILYEQFGKVGSIELGMEYLSHQTSTDGIQINFTSKTIDADVVLGADGINSQVRNQIIPDATLRSSKQICWRGISDLELPPALMNKGKEAWGHKIRFGFSNISPNQVYWFAVANHDEYNEPLDRDQLASIYKNFDPIVSRLIKNTSQWNTAVLKDLKRIPKWHDGRICLLGDAAHAMTPNMGQGACQGIEDAYYISHALTNATYFKDAFETFESSRRGKVDNIVNTSWTFGKMAHNPIGQALLRLIMKITPENIMTKQMNKLYTIESF